MLLSEHVFQCGSAAHMPPLLTATRAVWATAHTATCRHHPTGEGCVFGVASLLGLLPAAVALNAIAAEADSVTS